MFDIFKDMTTSEIVGNCISFAVTILMTVSFQIKSLKKLVAFQAVVTMIYGVAFIFLGAYQGAIQNIITSFARIVTLFDNKPWARSKIWIFVFSAFYLGAGVLLIGREGWISMLPAVTMTIYVIALMMRDSMIFRLNHLIITSPAWIVYDYTVKNFPGIITEVMIMISIIISFIRMRFDKKKELEKQEKSKSNS